MFQVKEIARHCQVTPETVRYYTRIGLLRPIRDPLNGYRQFNGNETKRLDFIRKAKRLGYSLNEIKHILDESQKGKSPCPMVRDLIAHRIQVNRARLEQLMELQVRMEQALANWANLPDGIPDGDGVCQLIESFNCNEESAIIQEHPGKGK